MEPEVTGITAAGKGAIVQMSHFLKSRNSKATSLPTATVSLILPFCTYSPANHVLDKNFRCSVCAKSFARQATLDRHERSHRGDKPYKCKICAKTFTDSSELSMCCPLVLRSSLGARLMVSETHSRTHSGEKPFKCTYPGCNFQTGDVSLTRILLSTFTQFIAVIEYVKPPADPWRAQT